MNSNRLWAVVNYDTNDILYSSFDYNRAKCAYDKLIQPVADSSGQPIPNIGDLWKIRFLRYDINPFYIGSDNKLSPFQKSLNDDFRAFLDFCLLKRGHNKNNNNTKEVKQC